MTKNNKIKVNKIPKVSIGLPVYNGSKYLKRTLDCLLGQTFLDFELIISDDGSTDATEEICRKYEESDPRVRYHRQPKNFGMPVKNFQFTLNKAIGEYFMFASHDDYWSKEYLKNAYHKINNNNFINVILSDVYISENKQLKIFRSPTSNNIEDYFVNNPGAMGSNIIIKKPTETTCVVRSRTFDQSPSLPKALSES